MKGEDGVPNLVHPARIELTSLVPETNVLSVELRVRTHLIVRTSTNQPHHITNVRVDTLTLYHDIRD